MIKTKFVLLFTLLFFNSFVFSDELSELRAKAESGDSIAQFYLARRYEFGKEVPRDDKKAFYWHTKSAEQGDAKAQETLGRMYNFGRGVTQDYKKAFYWHTKSAEQGDANAQFNLGQMYDEGKGVIQDYVQAHKWWNIASANGDELGRGNRDLIEKRMTPEQIAEAQRLASEWMEAHEKN